MNAETFSAFSEHWAGPLSNVLIALGAIAMLYPVIWRVSVTQLSAALRALEEAKRLPETIAQMNSASERLSEVNRELIVLKDQLASLDLINEKLEVANRRTADLQELVEAGRSEPAGQPVEPVVGPGDEATNWEEVAATWRATRDTVEALIGSIPDGRVRRKYNSATRYVYSEVVAYLQADGRINRETAEAINLMDSTFRSLRNRRTPVTPEVVDQFRQWHEVVAAETAL